jgi:MFS family permease
VLAPAGAIADAVGRVRLYLGGVGLFTAASLLAAAAPVYDVLVAARALQGLGAALLVPASLGLLLAEFPPERRQAAIGLWSATGALAAGAGSVLGGLAVDWVGWRALFCINLPIGLWLLWRGRTLLVGEQRGGRPPAPSPAVSVTLGRHCASTCCAVGRSRPPPRCRRRTASRCTHRCFSACCC